jgi:hypothetical protein
MHGGVRCECRPPRPPNLSSFFLVPYNGDMEHERIAVVEPQMDEGYHAPFNAAMLHTAVLAFPEDVVSFRSFPRHGEVVRGILQEHAPEVAERIEWRLAEPGVSGSIPARLRQNHRLLRQVTGAGERVLLTSVSRLQLLQLKLLMKGSGKKVTAVLHGDLDQLETPPPEGFPKTLWGLPRVLASPAPAGLNFIVLSESIKRNIPRQFHGLEHACVVDHPYHFPPLDPQAAEAGGPIFGVLGNTGDGALLEQVARRVKQVKSAVRFRLAGFLENEEAVARLRPYVEDVTAVMVPRSTYMERARSFRYALWLAEPGSFRLRASGTFFDALAYGKPLIYVANPFIDGYMAEAQEIGLRCDSVDAVADVVLRLSAGEEPGVYEARLKAIATVRERFTPAMLAPALRRAMLSDHDKPAKLR